MKSARWLTDPFRTQTVIILLLLNPIVASNEADPIPSSTPNSSSFSDILKIFQHLREESAVLREEAQQVREEGYAAMDKAYEVRDEAYEIKDSAYETRNGLESLLVEAFTLLKSQTTATSLYIQDMKNTLTTVANKVGGLAAKMEEMERKLEEKTAKLEEKMGVLAGEITDVKSSIDQTKVSLSEKVETSIALSTSVRNRQQVWMSEIRLISLYKTVDQNNGHPAYPNPIVTDGNFVINSNADYANTHSHTHTKATNNKLWINLGGYFKIHRVYIWNYRACCLEQLVGTHIYADEELIGAVVHNAAYHEFLIPEDDLTYASTITLHQPLPRNIHVLEVQVWGNGPFNRDDIFV